MYLLYYDVPCLCFVSENTFYKRKMLRLSTSRDISGSKLKLICAKCITIFFIDFPPKNLSKN